MIFNKHSELEGQHAFLSASNYHWIRYTDEKLESVYNTRQAAQLGTRLHAFAAEAIKLGIKQVKNRNTINMFINDAIGYKMAVEQILFYSYNAFGTADAISFRNDQLRIHDLKTGITKTSLEQLVVYAALFCLEYQVDPTKLKLIDLRIYKDNDIDSIEPDVDDILTVMDKIVHFDKKIENLKAGVLYE